MLLAMRPTTRRRSRSLQLVGGAGVGDVAAGRLQEQLVVVDELVEVVLGHRNGDGAAAGECHAELSALAEDAHINTEIHAEDCEVGDDVRHQLGDDNELLVILRLAPLADELHGSYDC